MSAAEDHFDLLVIGTGPAGEGAAMKAAKSGKRVAVAEQYVHVGGGSTHWGTIPSKALRRAIYFTNITFDNPIYRRLDLVPQYAFPELLATANQVIDKQVELRRSFYDRNDVRLIPGHARFLDPHAVEVVSPDQRRRYTADSFVIATGSRPWRPPDIDFQHQRIFDSDTLLRMSFTPRSLTIYGAGVIGCEYASMFKNMRLDVNLIDTRSRLLEFLDDEIADALSYHFSARSIRILHNEEYERVVGDDHGVSLHLRSGKIIRSEAFLFCNGRTGNSNDLGLEKIGIVPDGRGRIEVNEKLQTKLHPHIFAAGDIIGPPSLASASYDQGRFAATIIAQGKAEYRLVAEIPSGIYTSPEISSLGKTERELTAEKVPYEVGKARFATLARAQITGQTVGMLKICFHRETLELLGIHCFGENASEIIHIGQAIMAQPAPHNSLNYFVNTTFNYPTMAEAYRVAALNGLDRLR